MCEVPPYPKKPRWFEEVKRQQIRPFPSKHFPEGIGFPPSTKDGIRPLLSACLNAHHAPKEATVLSRQTEGVPEWLNLYEPRPRIQGPQSTAFVILFYCNDSRPTGFRRTLHCLRVECADSRDTHQVRFRYTPRYPGRGTARVHHTPPRRDSECICTDWRSNNCCFAGPACLPLSLFLSLSLPSSLSLSLSLHGAIAA